MPEGHTIHRLARHHKELLGGQVVQASSPQGRFTDGAALLSGQVLESTDAYGKHLFHRYSGRLWLHIHLGLFGKFRDGALPPPDPRGALRLRLVGADAWVDLRGPTACEVITAAERRVITEALGPDPLRRGAAPDRATARIARSSLPIGQLLMDQKVLAGVGNVYRAEVLFRQGLDPYTPGKQTDPARWLSMWDDLVPLMRAGVRAGRIITTERVDRSRRTGKARRDDAYYVYRRTGQACRHCGTPIRTAVLAARNLFWCPVCQPPYDS